MALNSFNNLGTLATVRDHVARLEGKLNFAALDATTQSIYNDFLEIAADRIAADLDFKSFLRHGEFRSGFTLASTGASAATLTGSDGAISGNPQRTFTSASSNFSGHTVVQDDALSLPDVEGVYRVLGAITGTTFTFQSDYAGTAVSSLAFTLARDRYPLDDGVTWVTSLQDVTNGTMIPIVSEEDFLEKTGGRFVAGTPQVAMLDGTVPTSTSPSGTESTVQFLKLWPFPDIIISFRYRYYRLPDVSAADHEFQPHLAGLWINATMVSVWARKDEFQRAQFHDAQYRTLLEGARRKEVNRSHQRDLRMVRQFIPGQRFDRFFVARGRETITE